MSSDRPAPWAARFRRTQLFDYSPAAARLWLALVLLGSAALALALWQLRALVVAERWQLAGWLLLVAAAAAFPVTLPRLKQSVSGADLLNSLVLALLGPAAAVLSAALEAYVASARTSSRLSSHAGSTAMAAVAMTIAGNLYAQALPVLQAQGWPLPAAQLALLGLAAMLQVALVSAGLMKLLLLKRLLPLTFERWFSACSWMLVLQLVSALGAGLLALNARQFGLTTAVTIIGMLGLALALMRAHFLRQVAAQEAQAQRVAVAEQEAQLNQRRFSSAFSRAAIGMAIVDRNGVVLQANAALHQLLGPAEGSLVGRTLRSLLQPGDAGLLERHVDEVLAHRSDQFSIELRCAGPSDTWVALHCALFDDVGAGAEQLPGLIFQLHDISQRRRAEGELRHIAYHDALTDLANRNCFQERLAEAVELSRTDRRRGFAVMVLDLDRFKIVNDSLGHAAGDQLLKHVAQRLAGCVRPSDLVARLGGDEFGLLLTGAPSHADALQLGERLLQALDNPLRVNGTELRVQASIGLTFSDLGYRLPDEVLRDADLAMYEAKAGGKARLMPFDARMHERIGHRLQLETDLRRAIGEGQLSLVYQPLYALDPHRLVGFEALARWTHPERGSVSPAVFIELAEESGCIQALTAWAVEEAVRQHAEWLATEGTAAALTVHVNVSGKDLARPGFAEHVSAALQRHGLPPRLLLLEITESTLMEHRDQALAALQALSSQGVKLGIDDFGTGYSSLAYLSLLPFDCLKIDRSFVMGMAASPHNEEIVRTVITLGRSLNKQVVAEGIETHEQLARLRRLGAGIGQGYLLGRPMGGLQALQLLREPLVAPV